MWIEVLWIKELTFHFRVGIAEFYELFSNMFISRRLFISNKYLRNGLNSKNRAISVRLYLVFGWLKKISNRIGNVLREIHKELPLSV